MEQPSADHELVQRAAGGDSAARRELVVRHQGAVYRLLGIPPVLFTPIFAVGRVAGWLAHILEQRGDNRIYRPESLYRGPEPREFVPLEKR